MRPIGACITGFARKEKLSKRHERRETLGSKLEAEGGPTGVDVLVAVEASGFNRDQPSDHVREQLIQHQSLAISVVHKHSISCGIWFGTRGSEVQILSPRPSYPAETAALLDPRSSLIAERWVLFGSNKRLS